MAEVKDEIIFKRCAGLDVHQAEIAACIRLVSDEGKVTGHARRFETTPSGLRALREWLREYGITHVAMEGTGVYWQPVYNELRGHVDVTVCNAHHVKKVPGKKKTDQSDASWLAQLLSYGALKKSFIPPDDIRELRELTRTRVHHVDHRSRVVNSIHRLLERIGLKLASVVSDLQGATAIAILQDLVAGVADPVALAAHAKGALRKKRAQLIEVLQVRVPPAIRHVLGQYLAQYDLYSQQIEALEQMAREALQPYAAQIKILMSAPGIDYLLAAAIFAEIGPDMSVFDGSAGLASWGGMAPGSHESAGKRKRVSVPHGNRYLSRALYQTVLVISRMKKRPSDLSEFFRRKLPRKGFKKAAVATGHKLLVRIWKMLSSLVAYDPPAPKPLTPKQIERRANRYKGDLERLGFRVILEPAA